MQAKTTEDKWRMISTGLLLLLLLLSVVLLAVAAWSLNTDEVFVLPVWAVNVLLAFAVIMLVFTGLGALGTRVVVEKRVNEEWNWPLIAFGVMAFVSLIVQLNAAGPLLSAVRTLDDAQAGRSTSDVRDLDKRVKDHLLDHESDWLVIQNKYGCCSYDDFSNVALATGDKCGDNPPTTVGADVRMCRKPLLADAAEQATALGVIGVQYAFILVLSVIATSCLVGRKHTRLREGGLEIPDGL